MKFDVIWQALKFFSLLKDSSIPNSKKNLTQLILKKYCKKMYFGGGSGSGKAEIKRKFCILEVELVAEQEVKNRNLAEILE